MVTGETARPGICIESTPRSNGAGPPEGEAGRGPDRGHPTARAGGASPKRVRQAAIVRVCAGTSLVQRGMEWKEDLPPGYRLREDPDLLILLRPDGSVAGAFSALGADPLEVIAEAWEDFE